MIRNYLIKIKKKTEYLNYGRNIIANWASNHVEKIPDNAKILDLGLGEGTDLLNIKKLNPNVVLYGVEAYEPNVKIARKNGILVNQFDIEKQTYPFQDDTFDVIVANQIIEHTKEIFWIFSEISRVLKPNGICIIGVPNLASLHNRIALLFGMQPPTMQLLGPHVRGIAEDSFRNFIEEKKIFKLNSVKSSNFYPFPAWLSKYLVRIFPNFAVSKFYLVERTNSSELFISNLSDHFFETPYFRGE